MEKKPTVGCSGMCPSKEKETGPSSFDQNLSLVHSSHAAFLEARREGLRQIGEMIRVKMNLAASAGVGDKGGGVALPSPLPVSPSASSRGREKERRVPSAPETDAVSGGTKESTVEDRDGDALFGRTHLEEFCTGSIVRCFGPEYAVYEGRRSPVRAPNGYLKLASRVLKVSGTPKDIKRPFTVVGEYDVPADGWYFKQGGHPGVMPYCIWMEIALQPCGFLSMYSGASLLFPDRDFRFRNLDGQGTILRPVDLRGKTVTSRAELSSTVTTRNTIIQQFQWDLSHGGEPVYEGTAVFGWFLPEALENQIGLDGGIANEPLKTREYLAGVAVDHVDLRSPAARKRFYEPKRDRPYERLAGPQLDFLDEAHVVAHGGKYGQGYVCGYKKIDPSDWFYPCHFYQDPVMPGSLGVESILQAMQIFSLHQELGAAFRSPRFSQRLNHLIQWKYRGQLIPSDDQMVVDVHIKSIEQGQNRITLIGDASLWKNDIRIYEIRDAAICLEESGSG